MKFTVDTELDFLFFSLFIYFSDKINMFVEYLYFNKHVCTTSNILYTLIFRTIIFGKSLVSVDLLQQLSSQKEYSLSSSRAWTKYRS